MKHSDFYNKRAFRQ